MEFGQLNKNHHFNMFTLSVATATVSVDTITFVHIFATFIFSVCTLSGATVTVSVDTMEFGEPNKNHHFNMFALSVATATVSDDTILIIMFCVYSYHYH